MHMKEIITGVTLLSAVSGVSPAVANINIEFKSCLELENKYQIEDILVEQDSVYAQDKKCDYF